MHRMKRGCHYILGLLVLLCSWQISALELTEPETALQSYINHQDGVFNIQHLFSQTGEGYTAHLYNLTSQKWLSDDEVDRSLWTHSLVIIIPKTVTSTTGMLFVGDDDNDDPPPDGNNPVVQIITQLALGSQSIVSAVFQVPNQPLSFKDDGIPRKEDKLVSISWQKALESGNYIYPAYLPMTKSVVKAMDGIQSMVADHGDYQIKDFVLTGFSKRGAATWLTAAIDPRVKAIAPGTIDFLNFAASFEHQYQSYGEFSEVYHEYIDLGILDRIRSPEFRDLAKVIDPYTYIDKFTMPKFILNAAGDQFFLPDASRFYFDDLPGETLIRFSPNVDHSLNHSQTGVTDSLFSLLGWYQSILYGAPRPEIHWHVHDQRLIARTSLPPVAVKQWSAFNPTDRDFRKAVIGEGWRSTPITSDQQGRYTVSLPMAIEGAIEGANEGYHATYIEFIYQGLAGLPVSYSTQVFVTPDSYAHELNTAVFEPKSAAYWKRQLKAVMGSKPADLSEDDWWSYLPIPLFDHMINDLVDVQDSLFLGSFRSLDELAERNCLATRLNIQAGEMGWYSHRDLGRHLGERPLWQHYQLADEQFDELPLLSSYICHQLNQP